MVNIQRQCAKKAQHSIEQFKCCVSKNDDNNITIVVIIIHGISQRYPDSEP